jgi:hypothetical protein
MADPKKRGPYVGPFCPAGIVLFGGIGGIVVQLPVL